MSNKRNISKQNSRLDRFLFYSKFVVLIIIAVLFAIAYSFSYRDFPVSSAKMEIPKHDNPTDGEDNIKTHILIVSNYILNYSSDAYTDLFLLKDLLKSIPDTDYDIVILENEKNSSLINNINDSLLLRINKNKEYNYIISLGDNTVFNAMEIRELFYPKAQMLLYGTTGSTINSIFTPVSSVSEEVINTINAAKKIEPSAESIILLCDNGGYSDVIINIFKNHEADFNNMSIEFINADNYSTSEAVEYINNNKNSLIFYLSFINQNANESLQHSQVINIFQKRITSPIYDLSPVTEGTNARNSLRYCPLASKDKAIAYLGVSLEDPSVYGLELIEFAAENIMTPGEDYSLIQQYESSYAFVNWCMENLDFAEFPDTVYEQFNFCKDNLALISKDMLRPGDLIFTCSDGTENTENIDGVSIYVNKKTVISINNQGLICFTKPESEIYQVAFAHPYSCLNRKQSEFN